MSSPPKIGGMKLHDAVIPDLAAGLYRVTSGLDISDNGSALSAPADQHTHFEVHAPRFALDPNEITDCFPPPGANGAFAERLPHISLGRRTLPWERRISENDVSGDKPWMALLLLREDEADIESGPLNQKLPAAIVAKLQNMNPIDGDPTIAVLKVRELDTFRQIIPRRRETSLLAHVRQVNLADTALAGKDDDGWFSVLSSNRLPVVNPLEEENKYMACLVSLEAREDIWNIPDRGQPPAMILLYSWRFTSTGASGTFEQLAANLDLAPFGGGAAAEGLLDEKGRLEVEHTQHSGEKNSAKYRGPLIGASAEAAEDSPEDISHAAAYELGRLLGIADGRFLRELVDWHRKAEAEIRASLEADELAARISFVGGMESMLTVSGLQNSLISNLNVTNLKIADIGRITLEGDLP
jgi:hypothetical protein